jgi:hypothetical protein
MLLVDTNVVIDVWQRQPEWWEWSVAQLRAQSVVHELAVNPVIYAELSLNFESMDTVDRELDALELTLCEPPRAALFLPAGLIASTAAPAAHVRARSVISSSARTRPCSGARF